MAPSSIKTLLPQLEKVFRLDGGLIYERQRALVRAGLLKPREGRGPGSGVAATPRALSLLLLAILASDNPAEGAERAAKLARFIPSAPISKGKCRITGQKNLLDAVAFLLGPNNPGQYPILSVARNLGMAQLIDDGGLDGPSHGVTEGFYSTGSHVPVPAIRVLATFDLMDLWTSLNPGVNL